MEIVKEWKKSSTNINLKFSEDKPTSLTDFSIEIILKIMRNINSIYDRMSLGMTCVRMYNIFNSDLKLHKDKLVKINSKNYHGFIDLFIEKQSINSNLSLPVLSNIKLRRCKTPDIKEFGFGFVHQFCNEYGKNILSLSFYECYHGERNQDLLKNILSYCPKLEELSIFNTEFDELKEALNDCSQLNYKKLKKLTTNRGLISDYALNHFIWNAPNLRDVDIDFPQEDERDNLNYKKLMKNNVRQPFIHENSYRNTLTYGNALYILPNSKITTWRPDESYTSYAEVKDICDLKEFGFKLDYFNMNFEHSYPPIEGENLEEAFDLIAKTYCESLIEIDFSDCYCYKTGCHRISGIDKLKNLKTLKLPEYISEKHLMELKGLKKLENLYLKSSWDCFSVVSEGLQLNDALTEIPNLRTLVIKGADLKDFGSFLNNTSAKLIELELYNCKMATPFQIFFCALTKNHKTLRKLLILNCDQDQCMFNEDLCSGDVQINDSVTEHFDGIGSLINLKSLTLNNIEEIDDESVAKEFKWNELTELKLSGCDMISDEGFLRLSKNCPAITSLDVCYSQITDKGIKYLCTNLTRLRRIKVEYADVTKNCLDILINSACPLSECEIYLYCDNFTLNSLELQLKLSHRY